MDREKTKREREGGGKRKKNESGISDSAIQVTATTTPVLSRKH